MPMEIDPPGGDCVEQLATVARIQINAFAALDVQRLRVERVLSKRVPDGERLIRHMENIFGRNCCEIRSTELRDQ